MMVLVLKKVISLSSSNEWLGGMRLGYSSGLAGDADICDNGVFVIVYGPPSQQ